MELKEVLTAAGLDDDQAAKVTTSLEENKLYVTDEENASVRLAKLKSERDEAIAKRDELQTSNDELTGAKEEFESKIAELEAAKGNDDEANTKLEELQKQLDEANNKNVTMTKQQKLSSALRAAGATDVDYVTYKLGGVDKVELDEDGNIKDWDKTLSGVQEAMPKYFVQEDTSQGAKLNGDNKPAAATDPFEKINQRYANKLEEK